MTWLAHYEELVASGSAKSANDTAGLLPTVTWSMHAIRAPTLPWHVNPGQSWSGPTCGLIGRSCRTGAFGVCTSAVGFRDPVPGGLALYEPEDESDQPGIKSATGTQYELAGRAFP